MVIKRGEDLKYSDVTPKPLYVNRRKFMARAALTGGAAVVAGAKLWEMYSPWRGAAAGSGTKLTTVKGPFSTDETQTPFKDATSYNNYYEFGTDKGDPAKNAHTLRTRPWEISIEGEVKKPRKISIEEILKVAPLEERIYRLRCVEGWSMVVPWIGYPLSALVKLAEPAPAAKYVAFETLWDAKQMPLGKHAGIDLPYVEGLRLDEAMHPLTIVCVGLYGETLPNQNGAPVRLIVPWKYGFKSVKSIVKIRFVKDEPAITWKIQNSREYGFYSNVNPNVDHPRWSQATERRLGEFRRRPTVMFNGYGDQVASLYAGMDLKKYY